MSVPVSKRGTNTLEVWQKSVKLTKHTMELVSNTRVFKGRYRKMNDELVNTAWNISEKLWLANNVYVGKGTDAESVKDRLHLQMESIALCRSMLFQIDLAGKILHLPSRQVAYWAGLAKSTLDLARKWHETDAKRLSARG